VQDVYDKTALELAKTKDMEINLKDDLERAHFDLEMVRERFDKASVSYYWINYIGTKTMPHKKNVPCTKFRLLQYDLLP
jgi:hypothetical protein